jgi:hypothetical protein
MKRNKCRESGECRERVVPSSFQLKISSKAPDVIGGTFCWKFHSIANTFNFKQLMLLAEQVKKVIFLDYTGSISLEI